MVIKTFVDGNSTLNVASNDTNVTGAARGFQTVDIAVGVTGVTVDANIERFSLPGNLSDYKFVFVPGVGTKIQNLAGVSIATIPSLNQAMTIVFADGSASLVQVGSSSFTLGSQTISTTAAPITSAALGTSFGIVSNPKVTLKQNSIAVDEGNAVILTATSDFVAPAGGLSIPYTLSGTGITTGDFNGLAALTGNINITAGSKMGTLTLTTTADTTTEGTETIIATLGNVSGASVNTVPVTVTINDTSPASFVSLSGSTSVKEGAFAVYTVTVDTPVTGTALTIPYTLSGTAENGTDYTGSALTGVLAIPVGATSAKLTLPVVADSITEGEETIIATLDESSTGYTVATGLSTVTTNVVDNPTTGTKSADVIKLSENHKLFVLNQAKGDSGKFSSSDIFIGTIPTSTFDVITNLQANDSIIFTNYGNSSDFVTEPLQTNYLMPGVLIQNAFWFVEGWYNYNTKVFSWSSSGIDKLLVYDSDPSASILSLEAIVLVGMGLSKPTATTSGVITF